MRSRRQKLKQGLKCFQIRGLLQGLEAEIHLVLDVMLPAWRVVDALTAFRAEFPTVSLRLYVEALGAVRQMAPAISDLSWLNPTPHAIAVYASQPLSPVATQHSLPSGRYSLLGPDLHRLIAPALPGAFPHSITSSAMARSARDHGRVRHRAA